MTGRPHTRSTRGPTVDVRCRRVRGAIDPRTVKRRAVKLLGEVGETESELSILLCDDRTIHELNRAYRKVDRPTDVLSFPLFDEAEDDSGVPRALGDVVISVETASRQAAQRRRRLMDEITTLLIHGLLHLLGHDHERVRERAAMEALATELERAVIPSR